MTSCSSTRGSPTAGCGRRRSRRSRPRATASLAPDLPGFGDAPLEPGTVDYVELRRRAARRPRGRRRLLLRRPHRARARGRPAGARRAARARRRGPRHAGSGRRRRRPASPRRKRRSSAATSRRPRRSRRGCGSPTTRRAAVRELTEAMTLRSYEQQLPVEGQVQGGLAGAPAAERLAEIGVPTLVVVGTEDVDDIQAIAEQARRRDPRGAAGDDRGRRPPAEPRAPGRAQPAAARLPSLSDGVRERGPRRLRPSRRTTRRPAPRRRAPAPGRPRGTSRCRASSRSGRTSRGELSEPVQCGDFASRSSKPSPQSFGSAGRSRGARRRGPGTAPTSPRRASRGRQRRREQLPAEARARRASVPTRPAAGVAVEAPRSRPSGASTASREVRRANGISARASTCAASATKPGFE